MELWVFLPIPLTLLIVKAYHFFHVCHTILERLVICYFSLDGCFFLKSLLVQEKPESVYFLQLVQVRRLSSFAHLLVKPFLTKTATVSLTTGYLQGVKGEGGDPVL